jgi:hypothetical protein
MVANLPFALLMQGTHPPRAMDPFRFVRASSVIGTTAEGSFWMDSPLWDSLRTTEPLYVDFETRGLNPASDSNFMIVGLGIATASSLPSYFGVDLSLSQEEQNEDKSALYMLCYYLTECEGLSLVAHNVSFDGMVMAWGCAQHRQKDFKSISAQEMDTLWANWKVCTYGLYRALASEDWIGQKHGLKNAMEDLLGWTDTNEYERDEWLIANGFSRKQANKLGGPPVDVPMKGEMWRVPISILGHYCALDCEATMLLHTKVLHPVAERFKGLSHFHENYFMDLVKNVTWQKLKGVTVDMKGSQGLLVYRESLRQEIKQLKVQFFARPEVRPHLDAWHAEKRQELINSKPEKEFKIEETLSTEPKKYNVSGKLSLQWEKWDKKRQTLGPPEKTERFLKWEQKVKELEELTEALYNGELDDGEDSDDESLTS